MLREDQQVGVRRGPGEERAGDTLSRSLDYRETLRQVGDGRSQSARILLCRLDGKPQQARGVDVVGAAGGDGTVNEVVNGLDGYDVPLGIIPLGTYPVAVKRAWDLAARLYHNLNDQAGRQRCLKAAVQQTLAMREEVKGSAGAEAGWVMDALQQLRHVEGEEKLEYDLYYLKHMSLGLDLFIMFETIKTIVRRRGAQ